MLVSVCSDDLSEQDLDRVALIAYRALVDSLAAHDRVVHELPRERRLHNILSNELAVHETSANVACYSISFEKSSKFCLSSSPDPVECCRTASKIVLTLTVCHWIVLVHWTS